MLSPIFFIKIKDNKIYLNETDFIPFSQTNIPEDSLGFKSNLDITWEVKSSFHDLDSKKIELEIANYSPDEFTSFLSQKLNPEIEKIEFKELLWSEVEPLLSYYKKIDLMHLCKEEQEKDDLSSSENKFQIQPQSLDFSTSSLNVPKKYHEVFNFLFSNIEFHDGYISFSEKFNFFNHPIEFKIFNPHLLKEFEYIKSYFPKVMGIKKFTVLADIEITDNRITERKATSPHIELIDHNFIEKISRKRILDFPKIKSDLEDSIFDLDELITMSDIPNIDSLPNQTEADVIKIFLEEREIRNQKQIEFLAFEKQSPKEKIKFNLKPKFGFIFLLEGKSNFYCWELLNDNATYIWSLKNSKPNETLLKKVEEIITQIALIGRQQYRKFYKENASTLDYSFHALYHDKVNVNPEVGFEDWKNNLEALLKNDLH